MIRCALILLVGSSFVVGDDSRGSFCFPTDYCRVKSGTDKRLIISKIREFMRPPPPETGGLEVIEAYVKVNETGKIFASIYGFEAEDRSYVRCITKFAVKPEGNYEVIHEPYCSSQFKELFGRLVLMLIEDDTFGVAVIATIIESLMILLKKWIVT